MSDVQMWAIREFVRRVDEAAEADMLAGRPITGAHNRAIRRVLADMEAEAAKRSGPK